MVQMLNFSLSIRIFFSAIVIQKNKKLTKLLLNDIDWQISTFLLRKHIYVDEEVPLKACRDFLRYPFLFDLNFEVKEEKLQ